MSAFTDVFIQAIQEKRKVRLTFFSKEDRASLSRICAPMDFGPSRIARVKNDRYHLWDYESDTEEHTLSLSPDQVEGMVILDEYFDPAEFITWSTVSSPWFVQRDWGEYS